MSHNLFADFRNGRSTSFAAHAITVPHALGNQPDRSLLEWHAAEVFRG